MRRLADVLLTLLPLLVAIVVTLELAVVLDIPLNFANIIALPLLLGVGVAFKIYYIMAWRSGKTALVQSTLTRAVIFSAMTQATAFGSLWLSSDPGTSSMGKLMALSLLCTMAAAVLFQPALMGRPRTRTVPLEPLFEPAPQFEFGEARHTAERPADELFGGPRREGDPPFSYFRFIPFWPTWISRLLRHSRSTTLLTFGAPFLSSITCGGSASTCFVRGKTSS